MTEIAALVGYFETTKENHTVDTWGHWTRVSFDRGHVLFHPNGSCGGGHYPGRLDILNYVRGNWELEEEEEPGPGPA